MTTEEITAALIRMGFTARTKYSFDLGNTVVDIRNAGLEKHPEIQNDFPPYLRVKVYGPGSERYAQFECAVSDFELFKNDQG